MAYRDYETSETVWFKELVGKTLASVTLSESMSNDSITFTTDQGEVFRQVYYDDCCANCRIEEIHGDLQDLVGTPIVMAEESSNKEPDAALAAIRAQAKAEAEAKGDYYSDVESETWTFYKIATIKGSVTIRWYGSSNGYYSESTTFERVVAAS
jgi:hypothetical protein